MIGEIVLALPFADLKGAALASRHHPASNWDSSFARVSIERRRRELGTAAIQPELALPRRVQVATAIVLTGAEASRRLASCGVRAGREETLPVR